MAWTARMDVCAEIAFFFPGMNVYAARPWPDA